MNQIPAYLAFIAKAENCWGNGIDLVDDLKNSKYESEAWERQQEING